ncbi:MAG: bifunctional phosphopantothenoylcysteine decarboxylase/phosphopantothenate--cysteine ligase CoaBC [Gammaproteobacteria bacterium]|nr:MAG: bifunctional phosphopantothenoylcysteine decarboxylase/phosphopantothenate--cysteine ligase CoaBC [Gammaproteobacteria bacterium]
MKNILLCVTGSIAAYKVADLLRLLQQENKNIKIIATSSALDFVSELTLKTLSHNQLCTDNNSTGLEHINLSRWADIIVVAPLTANTLAKISGGFADNLLTQTILAADTDKIYIAPAMNTQMWHNKIVQKNLKKVLKNNKFHLIAPIKDTLACGEYGIGKMAEIKDVVKIIIKKKQQGLKGKKIIITAGATIEPIDSVRFLSNYSSGKMAYAIVSDCLNQGAEVLIVEGKTDNLPNPAIDKQSKKRLKIIKINTAEQMFNKVMENIKTCDIFISVAAVVDYSPVNPATNKIKKTNKNIQIELKPNVDILKEVASLSDRPFCVGFAAETENLQKNATAKLKNKKLDLLVANDVSKKDIGFASDDNAVTLFYGKETKKLPKNKKTIIAQQTINTMILLYKQQK